MAVEEIPLSKIEQKLRGRILRRIAQFQPGNPKLNEAMLRIGFLLEAETKLQLRRKVYNQPQRGNYVRTGRLLNSIRFNVKRKGSVSQLTVGSFSVPYAQIIEFGFDGVQQIRQHRRNQTHAWGSPLVPPRSVTVRAHGRNVNIKARPFLGPAIDKKKNRIVQILADLFDAVRTVR